MSHSFKSKKAKHSSRYFTILKNEWSQVTSTPSNQRGRATTQPTKPHNYKYKEHGFYIRSSINAAQLPPPRYSITMTFPCVLTILWTPRLDHPSSGPGHMDSNTDAPSRISSQRRGPERVEGFAMAKREPSPPPGQKKIRIMDHPPSFSNFLVQPRPLVRKFEGVKGFAMASGQKESRPRRNKKNMPIMGHPRPFSPFLFQPRIGPTPKCRG